MRTIHLCIFLILATSSSFANNTCDLQKQSDVVMAEKRLTTFWAQEYIGSDLVRLEINEYVKSKNIPKVNVAILDLGFEEEFVNLTEELLVPSQMSGQRKMRAHHGTSVANLINGEFPYGMTDHLNLIRLGRVSGSMYRYHFVHFEKQQRYPKIISNSVGWGGEKDKDVAQLAYEQNILWFLAAGNKYPEPIVDFEISSKAILIGSLAPSGLQSFNTQTHNDIAILAPGNQQLATINGFGEHALFGETSGATPLVAGTMVNIAALLPSITREQTITLLEKSGFESSENILGNQDAPKVLNSYKAFKVAQRIYEKCDDDLECIDRNINTNISYVIEQAITYSCSEFKELSCLEKENALIEMRKEALLSGEKVSMGELSCAYMSLGFEKNAEYYNLRSNGLNLNDMEVSAKKAIDRNERESSYYKYLKFYSSDMAEYIKNSSLNNYDKEKLLKLL